MEKKFRIKSIRRETEDKVEYIEDYTDCIITVEEVKSMGYFKDEIYIDKESGGEVIIHEIHAQGLCVYDSVTKEAIVIMRYDKFYNDYFLKKDKGCVKCGYDGFLIGDVCEQCARQIQSQPIVKSGICGQCGGVDRCLCDREYDTQNKSKETLVDKVKLYLGSPSPVCPDGKVCEKIAKIALDYYKDNPDEILPQDKVIINIKALNNLTEGYNKHMDMVSKDKYDALIEANYKLADKSLKHRDDYNRGFEDGFNTKKPKDSNHLFDIESIIEALKKEKGESYPFDYLIWYLKSSIKGMVSHKKVMKTFDYVQTLTHEYGSRKDFMRVLRTALENMEKK